MDEDFVSGSGGIASRCGRSWYPPLRTAQGRGTHCVGDVSEIKSLGHPPTSRGEGEKFDAARATAFLPTFFHHIFPVRSSQTCTAIAEKIPRQYTIENCARLQRRTHFRPQTFHRYFDNIWPRSAPRKCTPNGKIQR